jgi:inner membrane transporter RhtA
VSNQPPAWSLAVGSMLTVQVAAALSTRLFPVVGPAGTAWLRLAAGAVIFLALARPRFSSWTLRQLRVPIVLGLATGAMTVCFLSALDRIPLGTTVAIEFLGPLGVAVVRSHDRRALLWPALALLGVVAMTRPWTGEIDPVGVLLALVSAACWATYIVLTQHVGDRFSGLDALAISIPVAAIAAAAVGVPQAWGHITGQVVLQSIGLALLLPVLSFSLELVALRRLTAAAFGTLMSLEPALGTAIGVLLLAQVPDAWELVGVVLVVVAGIGAERSGHREPSVAVAVPPGTA